LISFEIYTAIETSPQQRIQIKQSFSYEEIKRKMPIKIDHCYLLTHKININSSAGWQKSFHIIIVNRVRLGHVRGSGSARNELYTFPLWRIFPEIKVHLSSVISTVAQLSAMSFYMAANTKTETPAERALSLGSSCSFAGARSQRSAPTFATVGPIHARRKITNAFFVSSPDD
jgi:hypothetical protein